MWLCVCVWGGGYSYFLFEHKVDRLNSLVLNFKLQHYIGGWGGGGRGSKIYFLRVRIFCWCFWVGSFLILGYCRVGVISRIN